MPHRQDISKPEYRFTVVDEALYTWGVLDTKTGKKVRTELRSSWEAKDLAEKFNLDPDIIDNEYKDQETTS